MVMDTGKWKGMQAKNNLSLSFMCMLVSENLFVKYSEYIAEWIELELGTEDAAMNKMAYFYPCGLTF